MTLVPGSRLGPYEIVAPLGQGGMGEVYRAKDTRLGRQVAVKVLPPATAASPEVQRRFEQEARAVSALSHPNILVVHDVGEHDAALYVVSELLEGTTLREQLLQGSLAPARAVAYGIEIARGLAAAHERGIVHRDLKPENVFVTRDGRIKILDFGVATLSHGAADGALETTAWHVTAPGVVLGTVGYMSPEQVRGEGVDTRSDVFALGVVLYEMLSGRGPFTRTSSIETLHAILADTPDALSDAVTHVPPALDRVVQHCLEKDRSTRFQSARDVAFALEGLTGRPSAPASPVQPATRSPRRQVAALAVSAVCIAALGAFAGWYSGRVAPADAAPSLRFEIPAPANGTLQGILGISSAISPDGTTIALAVTTEAGHRLFLRPLASTTATLVEGSEGAVNPFWSPDSRSVGFFTPGKVKRAPVSGGPSQTISNVGSTWGTVGAWAADDTILVSGAATGTEGAFAGSFLKISASGGTPTILAGSQSRAPIGWPWMLPDGRHFLFSTYASSGPQVRVGSLDSPETATVVEASSRAVYAPPGYLLFVRDGTLMAQRFELDTLRTTGTPRAVADGLLYFSALGQADFSASNTGVLVYQAGTTASRLLWYSRSGLEQGQVGDPGDYFFLRLSPSGRRVAVDVMDRRTGVTDIQVFDLARGGRPVNVTSDRFVDWTPVFSPDEQQLAFASNRRGPPHIHLKGLNDAGVGRELLAPSQSVQFVTDWSAAAEGPFIVFSDDSPRTQGDIFMVSLSEPRTRRPLVQTPADEADGRVSPDGRWLAYVSAESGQTEVYVRPMHGSSQRWQVSNGGGLSPRWRRDGGELYYLGATSLQPFGPTVVDGKLMAVSIARSPGFEAGVPTPLFSVRARQGQYEPSADGQRFLVNSGSGSAALPITVVTNWTRSLGQ